jgi:hypothetical protein
MTRVEFREFCLARDHGKCVLCGTDAQDVHHILERRLFPVEDGGYHADNGVSVCGACHLKAEQTLVSPEELREAAGIVRARLPPHLYADERYDKWGNQVISGGRRLHGELFHDPSVQSVLRDGGVLGLFTTWVKYPRTHHLPWSPGMHDDDRIIQNLRALQEAPEVVVTVKHDGENSSLYSDHLHARSVESGDHASRHWLKNLWARVSSNIPTGWRVCGENLYAEHSIHYAALPSYFLAFSIWDDHNVCLSWGDTLVWLELLGLSVVPTFYLGVFDPDAIQHEFDARFDTKTTEGYVVRVAGSFSYRDFRTHVAKWVRPGHVQTTKHWMHGQPLVRNGLVR